VNLIFSTVRSWYDLLLDIFTDKEAWFLFRAAAFLETLGWTLLISGIIFSKLKLPAYEFVLPIAGSLHGVFFIIYVLIVFFAHRSMNWGISKFIIAEIAGNIPGGALVFEIIEKRRRKYSKL